LHQKNDAESISAVQTGRVPLQYYIDVAWSSKWIISAFVIACVGAAFLASKLISPTYLVNTTVIVSKANLQQSPYYDTILIAENLAFTYAKVITNGSLLDQVSSRLNSRVSTEELRRAITADPISNTQLIEISVEYPDPKLAVQIADNLVEVLSSEVKRTQLESATNQDGEIDAQLQKIESEIARLQEKIKAQSLQLHKQRLDTVNSTVGDLRSQIEQIDREMAPLLIKPKLTASEQFDLSDKETRKAGLSALVAQYQNELVALTVVGPTIDPQDFVASQDYALLDQYQRTYSSLRDIRQNSQVTRMQNMVMVTQVYEPVPPESPVRPNLKLNLMFGFVAGLLLATIYIFITKLGRL
jgi:capsular polysaccharide biosynthesis protein